jgi:hypothetical protein
LAKIAVSGSRSIDSFDLVSAVLDNILVEGDIILSGNAPGADRLGEEYAEKNGYERRLVPSEWENHGPKATMLRNEVLLKACDFIICFWDGKSEGAKHMIDISKKAKKLLALVNSDGYIKLFMNPRLLSK